MALVGTLLLAPCGGGIVGCDARRAETPGGSIPSGAFAVVGSRALSLGLLRYAAEAAPPSEAHEALIRDARSALEAGERWPHRQAVVERGLLARGLVDQLRARSLESNPPIQAELDRAARALWAELDRPRTVRTAVMTAEVPPLGDGEREQRVLARMAAAIRGAASLEDLNRRATEVDREGASITAAIVPPVTEDGRVYVETAADAGAEVPTVEYARAAARLTHVGDTSGVLPTSAGYQVLVATAILPPRIASPAERTQRLHQAVADQRVVAELEALRSPPPGAVPIWKNPHQTALTSLVWRAPNAP